MKYGGPIMVTFSKGGGQFIAGKAVSNANDQASIAGTIAGAKHVHEVAKLYGVPVVVHTDHCQKAWLPWIDGLLVASEEHFAKTGEPLFSSHMLDLSEEPLEENIAICKSYLEKFAKVGILLEFELGVTGGEEDGVDNSDVDSSRLYTQPEEVSMKFVFHGGSGSSVEDIQYAIGAGVVKMNIDTDTQWAFWDGIRAYEAKYHDYLQGQIGNSEGPEKPNKKYYDPRMSLRAGEESMAARLIKAAEDLKCVNVLN